VRIRVNPGWGRRAAIPKDSPELTSAGVAEHGSLSTGEHGRHPPSRLAQAWVPDCEDPAMNAVKAAGLYATEPTPLADPGGVELPD
jgi:hypothetical protein